MDAASGAGKAAGGKDAGGKDAGGKGKSGGEGGSGKYLHTYILRFYLTKLKSMNCKVSHSIYCSIISFWVPFKIIFNEVVHVYMC